MLITVVSCKSVLATYTSTSELYKISARIWARVSRQMQPGGKALHDVLSKVGSEESCTAHSRLHVFAAAFQPFPSLLYVHMSAIFARRSSGKERRPVF